MEEYDIDDDLVEAYVMSGDVQPYESEPEPMGPAAASGAPVVMKDGNSAGHHEGGADADEDIVDEDSPVFLTAVSHTTESDAVGGEAPPDEARESAQGGAAAADDAVGAVGPEAPAIAAAKDAADLAGGDADRMEVDDVADEGHQLKLPSAEDTKEMDKKPAVGTTEDGVLRALAKMAKPITAASRRLSTGMPACALDGCDKRGQGLGSYHFCKKHCRMWKEANAAKAGVEAGVVADAARSTRKRRRCDETAIVGDKAPVAAEEVSVRSSKTRKPTRTSTSDNTDQPSLVNQVVRLTTEGREAMGESLIQGIEPRLYFVLNYDAKTHECKLVPMRIVGCFRAKECKESKGRDKWMLYPEKDCKGQKWEISGNMLEAVQARTVLNTTDADDEQWDVLENVAMSAPYNEAAELTQSQNAKSKPKPPAKFSPELSVYAREDDGLLYKSKIKKKRYNQVEGVWEYEVHFIGWAAKYDRWVPEDDVALELPPGEVAGPVPNSSPAAKEAEPDTNASPQTNSDQSDVSSACTGTRIDAKCSSPSVKTGSSCVAPTQGDETILHVDRILGRRWNSKLRRIEFLTVWSGFPDPSENSWEPETNFSLQSLAIFGRMWGKANDLPHDGTAEMLSDGEIRKMQVIQDGGTEADSAQIKSTRSGHSSETTPARSAIVWTPVNECILLLTALEHPEDLVAEGPGLWMVTKSEWRFEGVLPSTDRQIRNHFEGMVRRKCDQLTDHSALDYGRHVLNFALATAPPSAAAKNLALVAAGWFRIAGGSGLDCSKAIWHRPSLDLKGSYCRLSEKRVREHAVSLDLAWLEHEKSIRDAIEEAWIPTIEQGEEAVGDDGVVDGGDDAGAQDVKQGGAMHLDEVADANGRVVMEGAEPKKLKSDERDDWVKYSKSLNERKKIVISGDPRPILTCRWCGVRPYDIECYEEKTTEQHFEYRCVPATCKACKYLEELGWKFNIFIKIYSEAKRKAQNRKEKIKVKVISPDGKTAESVKEFLRISTSVVSKEFHKNDAFGTPLSPAGGIDQGRSTKPNSKVALATSSGGNEVNKKGEDDERDIPEVLHERRPKPMIMKPALPAFDYLLQLERGLVTVLAADDLHYWNAYYGTNSTVALCVMRPLARGKLPRAVQSETPFFRPRDELNVMSRKGGAPPTRFLGVSRAVNPGCSGSSVDETHHPRKFGVEFPLFDANKDPLVPQSATIKGRAVLIRDDLTEDVAGRLYTFMFRLLYGTAAVERMLKKTNGLAENVAFVQDTLRAFGATGEEEEGAS